MKQMAMLKNRVQQEPFSKNRFCLSNFNFPAIGEIELRHFLLESDE